MDQQAFLDLINKSILDDVLQVIAINRFKCNWKS